GAMPGRHRAIISWHWLCRGPLPDGKCRYESNRGAGREEWPPTKGESMSTTTATAGGVNELKRNVLGLPSAMVMSIAFISPTIGVIFISALIGGQAGISSPFAFILGTLGIALMA